MKKDKKEIEPNFILEVPSKSFCIKCKSSDVRKIKDTLNLAATAIYSLTDELGLEVPTFEGRCKNIMGWVKEQQKKREKVLKIKRKDA